MNRVTLEPLATRFQRTPARLNQIELAQAIQQVLAKIDAQFPRFSSTFPSACAVDGRYLAVEKVDWTEGFWTGLLWLAFQVTGDDKYRQVEEIFLDDFALRLDKSIHIDTHDLGFLYQLSYVNARKVTGNIHAREIALTAAEHLYRRYNATAGVIQAWGDLRDPARQGRIIIDCNLNLPLLFWAANETGNSAYRTAAATHLRQAARYLVRDDASTFHTYYLDIHTGNARRGNTHQGFSDNSCWARGQAWGIYSFALGFNYTGDPDLPILTRKLTHYFLNRLPDDFICYWDLIFTDQDRAWCDTSAAAIAVCGMLELLKQLPQTDEYRTAYLHAVATIMRQLQQRYRTGQEDGLLREGVYNYGRNMGINVANLWGDYFYFEALVRLSQPWSPYW